jgi:hypothetical protein
MSFFDKLNSYIVTNDYRSLFPHIKPTTILRSGLTGTIIKHFRGDEPDLIDQLYENGITRYHKIWISDLMDKPRMLMAFLRHEPEYPFDAFVNVALFHGMKIFVILYEFKKIRRTQTCEKYLHIFDALVAARESVRLTSSILLYIGRNRGQKDIFRIFSRVVWSKRGDGN